MQVFSLKPGRSIWREVLDQFGHVGYSACLMSAFIFPVPAWVAVLLVMAIAFERELEQHSWDVSAVGRQDMFFWSVAAVLFAVVYYLI